VAIERIVNPRLPLRYELDEKDLVLPGKAWGGPLTVKVLVNRHGKVGVSERGDLRGIHKGKARSGEQHVNVVVDEETP
jgi:hypothetical protein